MQSRLQPMANCNVEQEESNPEVLGFWVFGSETILTGTSAASKVRSGEAGTCPETCWNTKLRGLEKFGV